MKIQAPFIANLFEYAAYKNISEEWLRSFLSDKTIDVCDLNTGVTQSEYLKVFEALLDKTGDNDFGIHYGCYLNLKALGLIAQLSLHTSGIRQAVFILQSYLESTFPLVNLEGRITKQEYILELTSSVNNETIKNQILDFTYCFMFRELSLMLPNEFLPQLEVPRNKVAEFSRSLNVKVEDGSQYRFYLSASILDVEINRKKLKEIEKLLPKFLQMLNKKGTGSGTFSVQVKDMVLNLCSPQPPSFEQVAVHFPLSNRTIQRKLTEEGLTFRKIVDDIKKELSGYLAKGNKIKTQDIAYILGYSEPSAYLHAVKKWRTG